ncbi:MAG: hypothetical protein KDD00_08735 [Ignavibacteriae bacterium]|nr:hypothetical protein [Ignavibacteriota bacterium]
MTTGAPTITDNGVECHCKIYGMGVIKNTYVGTTGNVYECIKITNANTELEITCDLIEGIGGINIDSNQGACVNVTNGKKFHLKCNYVYNHRNVGLVIGTISNIISDFNLTIKKIETGIQENNTPYGTTGLITYANGFISISEIFCSNLGHCFSHRAGLITAKIFKMKTINNVQYRHASTVQVPGPNQGSDSQKLILYFDEIQSLREIQQTGYSSDDAIQLTGGTGIFVGRRAFSTDGNGLQITRANTKGYLKCNELISSNRNGLGLNNFTNQITLDVNYIEGNNGDAGAVFVAGVANFILKNAKCKNLANGSNSRTFWIIPDGNDDPIITFVNLKIVSDGHIIFFDETLFGNLEINNYGLFVNKEIDSNIKLLIGKDNSIPALYNYLYIVDILLS